MLLLGDCLDLMKGLEPGSIDLICTDLPYGSTYCRWDSPIDLVKMWLEVERILKPTGSFITTASMPFTATVVASNYRWFRHESIWTKDRATGHLDANIKPMKKHESILVFSKKGRNTYNPQMEPGQPYTASRSGRGALAGNHTNYHKEGKTHDRVTINKGNRYPTSVKFFPSDSMGKGSKIHETRKPVALFEYIIKTWSNSGDLVLDIAAGSGTTGIAALNTDRKYILMEKDSTIFSEAEKRLLSYQSLLLDNIANSK